MSETLVDQAKTARWVERLQHMDPPDAEPFRELACAVIFNTAREYRYSPYDSWVLEWFNGPEFRFWAKFIDLRLTGEQIAEVLVENGGVPRGARLKYNGEE